jgi:hypothetical protein
VPRFLGPYGEAGTDSDTELWILSALSLNTALTEPSMRRMIGSIVSGSPKPDIAHQVQQLASDQQSVVGCDQELEGGSHHWSSANRRSEGTTRAVR